jgi:hypothetical protein
MSSFKAIALPVRLEVLIDQANTNQLALQVRNMQEKQV